MINAYKITESDQEVFLEVDGDRLLIDWVKIDKDNHMDGGATFSIPIKVIKKIVEEQS